MTGTQPSVYSPSLTIDVARFVAPQEQGNTRHLIGMGTAPQRVDLPNLFFGATRARGFVHGRRHARLNDTWANGVDADVGAGELVRDCLRGVDDGGFGGSVRGGARV